jgi:hypothetical protein
MKLALAVFLDCGPVCIFILITHAFAVVPKK